MSHDDLPPSADPSAARPEPMRWADEEPRRMSGRGKMLSWIGGLIGLALLIGLAWYLSHSSSSSSQQGGAGAGRHRGGGGRFGGRGGMNQPTTVGTARATLADLPIQAEALGTVTPAATVTVRPQVSGTITQILFREGQMVRKGETL
ncbi:MAG: efflux transporter periplasmic adaptor subunit, partial [Sphingomonas oligoaromativorans]